MNNILTKYDIIDTFDDNTFQTVLMGIDIQTMSDIVIINKLKPTIQLDNDFFSLYKKISDNLITLEVNDQETIIINQYKQSQMLTDYLKEEDLSFDARLTLAKSFLLHSVNYDQFDASIKYILINEDQLTVRNNTLYFSNYLFLKKYHADVSMQDVLKSIGKILEIILQQYKEPLTPSSKPLQSLVYRLINEDLKWSVKDIYQEFNTIFSQITSESTSNSIPSSKALKIDEIISLSKEKNNITTVQQLKQNDVNLKSDNISNEPITNLTDDEIITTEIIDSEITSHNFDDINDSYESILVENNADAKEKVYSIKEYDTNQIQETTVKTSLNESYDEEHIFPIKEPLEGKHHKIVLEKKSTNSIQEILDRNVKLHNTLNSEKNKKRYFPTFLLFFIFLIVITFLLILYSSTYT